MRLLFGIRVRARYNRVLYPRNRWRIFQVRYEREGREIAPVMTPFAPLGEIRCFRVRRSRY